MKAFLRSPARMVLVAIALIVVIEVATIAVPDDSGLSDARFLMEIGLVVVILAALAVAVWRRLRRDAGSG